MLTSAILHATGISEASPPRELVIGAQLVLGAFIGARFLGERFSALKSGLVYAVGHVSLMMAISLVMALFLNFWLELPVITGVLAFAPGGLAEMSLVALGLGLDVGVVATLHVSRVLVIVMVAPAFYERMKKHFSTGTPRGLAMRRTGLGQVCRQRIDVAEAIDVPEPLQQRLRLRRSDHRFGESEKFLAELVIAERIVRVPFARRAMSLVTRLHLS